MTTTDQIVDIILQHYPATQAIYLFGSYGTADELPNSDVDLAILQEHWLECNALDCLEPNQP